IRPSENFNKLDTLGFIKHLALASVNRVSRHVIQQMFSKEGSLLYIGEELERQSWALRDALSTIESKWSGVTSVEVLGVDQIWAHMRFLATFQPRRLDTAGLETPPETNWDHFLTSGDL